MKISIPRLLPCLLLLSTLSALCTAQSYTITDLGTLPNDNWSQGQSINASGQSTGASGNYQTETDGAFVFRNGMLTNLGSLGGKAAIGNGINASGEVAGYSQNATGAYRAFISNGDMLVDIGDLGGGSAVAYAINDAGQVVGSAVTATGANHPFLYSNGQMTDLGTLGSPDNVDWWNSAQGINNSGVVTGTSYDAQGNFFGFVWSKGKMTKIGTLGGSWSEAEAINNLGQVTGMANTKNGSAHAYLRSPQGKLQDLGTVGASTNASWGFGVNDAGVVVGRISLANTYHAFVYSGGKIKDLNKLIPANSGWVLQEADGINNAGQIVGSGTHKGQPHAFLLTPQ